MTGIFIFLLVVFLSFSVIVWFLKKLTKKSQENQIMKNIYNLLQSWSLPDRTKDRAQLTLRVNYELYAKFQALKELYPSRSVNDLVVDVLSVGVEDVIAALPIYEETLTFEEASIASSIEQRPISDFEGLKVKSGPGVEFLRFYSRMLSEKSDNETKNDEVKQ